MPSDTETHDNFRSLKGQSIDTHFLLLSVVRDGSGSCSLIAEGIGSPEGDTGRLGSINTELKNTCMARKNIRKNSHENAMPNHIKCLLFPNVPGVDSFTSVMFMRGIS